MKSTLKIHLQPIDGGTRPVIKIVQPAEIRQHLSFDRVDQDDDPKDDMIQLFLHGSCNTDPYDWFKVGNQHPIPNLGESETTHYLTTIEPVEEKDLFYRFKHAILNRVIPYEDLVAINREEIPNSHSKQLLEQFDRPVNRIDESVEKYSKIEDFFKWLADTGYCSWEERQPDMAKADLNSNFYKEAHR